MKDTSKSGSSPFGRFVIILYALGLVLIGAYPYLGEVRGTYQDAVSSVKAFNVESFSFKNPWSKIKSSVSGKSINLSSLKKLLPNNGSGANIDMPDPASIVSAQEEISTDDREKLNEILEKTR